MFGDIRKKHSDAATIAIVSVTDDAKEPDDISNGLAMLRNEARIVNWLNLEEQNVFLDERHRIATQL